MPVLSFLLYDIVYISANIVIITYYCHIIVACLLHVRIKLLYIYMYTYIIYVYIGYAST